MKHSHRCTILSGRRFALSALILGVALMGCSQTTTPLERALRAYARGESSPASFAIDYKVGNGFVGFTELTVDGEGKGKVRSNVTAGRALFEESFTVGQARVTELAQAMIDQRLWTLEPQRAEGVPDEAQASIKITAGPDAFQTDFWLGEAKQTPAFLAIQDKILGLAREVSNGAILDRGQ